MTNKLYYGDNLQVLREHIADDSVDLIYLDPPFNSKRDYNLLFKTPKGMESDASITAFEDTWHWGQQAQDEFREIEQQANTDVAEMMRALHGFLGENDMMAYLVMMCNRLLDMHRVLKRTGSLYLHCDPTASHYLKIVLDGVFGKENFRNEIVWRRTGSHNSAKKYGPIHDVILFFTKSKDFHWNKVYQPYTKRYVEDFFKKEDSRGKFRSQTLTGSGTRKGQSGEPWNGYDVTTKGRHWAFPGAVAEEFDIEDLPLHEKLDFLKEEGMISMEVDGLPEYRQYLHNSKGTLLQDIWAYQPYSQGLLYSTQNGIDEDVKWLEKRGGGERLGYPTQKPLALLERIVQASSNEGDVVLDPFCGCGTAVHAAQKLNRRWIGIDITHLAVSLIEKRLKQAFPELNAAKNPPQPPFAKGGSGGVSASDGGAMLPSSAKDESSAATSPGTTVPPFEKGGTGGICFEVIGVPGDIDAARDLAARDKHQFQLWACTLVGAQPYKGGKKGADRGVDGMAFIEVDKGKTEKIIVSVKGGEHVGSSFIRDLKGVVEREKAAIGLFVTLTPPTKEMKKEAAASGHYESPHHGAFPKIQILTIEGLLNGTERAQLVDMAYGGQTFKQAKAEKGRKDQKGLFE